MNNSNTKEVDRRKFVRLAKSIPVKFRIRGLSEEYSANCRNIGEGGIFIGMPTLEDESLSLLFKENKLNLEITLPPTAIQIKAEARLAWIKKEEGSIKKMVGIGIEFIQIKNEERDAIAQYILEELEGQISSLSQRLRLPRKRISVEKVVKRRVVITGIGVIAPNGIGKDAFWKALINGKSGVRKIARFNSSLLPIHIAGEVNGFDPCVFIDFKKAKRMDRFAQFSVAAAKMAVEDARLNIRDDNTHRIGVAMGTAVAGIGYAEDQYNIFREKGWKRVNPSLAIAVFSSSSSSQVSIELKINGPSLTISCGCASGAAAIGYGFNSIRRGETDIMIVGGSDAPITPAIFAAFTKVEALSRRNDEPERACRPFNKDRDGTVLSEGAGVLILEELEHALSRNAHIYAEIIGYGASSDAHHMTQPLLNGKWAAEAMRLALQDANLSPKEIDYINAHGSSTPYNDGIETKVIKDVFGKDAYRLAVSSIKSMIGHTQGACGAIEAIACALAIEKGLLPPTINYEVPDSECDLDYVPNRARKSRVDVAMSNSFGFGGNNAILIIKKFKEKNL